MKLRDQLYIYLIPSITLGLLFNTIRDKGISHLAQPSIELSIGDNLTVSTSVPTIRNINLDLAIKFHNEGFLFVDARAEEYLNEGFIPNAISHDNIDTLDFSFIDPFADYEGRNRVIELIESNT